VLNRSGLVVYKSLRGPVQAISHFHFSLFSRSSERSSHFSLRTSSSSLCFLEKTKNTDEDSGDG
jgi:hypothetical protein